MARVHTARAARDYPEHGIQKGDTYYWWQLWKCPKQMSKTYPKQSQLTNSKMSGAYAAVEDMESQLDECSTPEEIVDVLQQCVDELNSVAEEYRDSASSMEDAFPGGSPTIDLCNENADNIEAYVKELEQAIQQIEDLDSGDYILADELRQMAVEELGEESEDDEALAEDRIQERMEKIREDLSFDDLPDVAKADMLTAAREIASTPDCPF